ncbi:MAG: carboxypeptidase-like regulatory domain-containing protein, partial [Gemmataceae bacterium]
RTSFSSKAPVEITKTDEQGRYHIRGLWAKDLYSVKIELKGYMESSSDRSEGVAGKTDTFPDIQIVPQNVTLVGSVRDSAGKPIADVELLFRNGQQRAQIKSAADGSFQFPGLSPVEAFVIARKPGYQPEFANVVGGSPEKVSIVLRTKEEPPVPLKGPSAEHEKALMQLHRDLLMKMWTSRAQSGYGYRAIEGMAKLDLPTAEKWRDEEKERSKGKVDYTQTIRATIRESQMLPLAQKDFDELLAEMAENRASNSIYEYSKLCKLMLPVDTTKALRAAEEYAVRARKIDPPARMMHLAQAGAFATKAGGKGEVLLAEAAELALAAPVADNTRESMYVGYVASQVAIVDPVKAEKILARLSDSDHNRFIVETMSEIGAIDTPRAKSLLEKFRPDGSSLDRYRGPIRLGLAIADTKPDEALAVVQTLKDNSFHPLGLIELAHRWAKTDRERAIRTIDMTFDYIEANPNAFRSYFSDSEGCRVA